MTTVQKELIYLLSCAVNGLTPDTEKLQAVDLEKVYGLAKSHTVRAAVCIALERAGIKNEKLHDAMKKAVRKNILLDMERTAVFEEFEKHGIWYMLLKGSILKELYPENGMREMADNDVLYNSDKQEEVKQIFLDRGYHAESFGKGNHDVYMKPPVLNFEMHSSLFSEYHSGNLYSFYQNTERFMIKDTDNGFGYHFSDEDFYIFMTAHEWKHFSGGGTGIRSLLDCYVFIKNKGESLDTDYIAEQMEKLGIADFEKERRSLAMKAFSPDGIPALNEAEEAMLKSYFDYGTYGTLSHSVETSVEKYFSEKPNSSKLSYIWRKIFPDSEHMKTWYPFFYKHKLLLPIGYIWRWIKAIFRKRQKIKAELNAVIKYDKKQ
ncbi:MAG: nucleotidyltransferase family protein [Ruminococcus sp.]|nr:nucleotidyltransferase family protein [Ruminococcus sp.]